MIPAESLDLIKSFEGYLRRLGDGTDRVRPYRCPADVPTIGYGSTRYFPGGKRVTMADPPISEERARECLAGELIEDEGGIDRYTSVPLHPLMRGALVSFAYNCGVGAYQASTLRRYVNERRWDDVPAQLNKWRMGGGKILSGLARRRADEGKMFQRGVAAMLRGESAEMSDGRRIPQSTAPVAVSPTSAPARSWGILIKWFFNLGEHHVG